MFPFVRFQHTSILLPLYYYGLMFTSYGRHDVETTIGWLSVDVVVTHY